MSTTTVDEVSETIESQDTVEAQSEGPQQQADSTGVLESLDGDFKDAALKNPHLAAYLNSLASQGIKTPDYKMQLSRSMRDGKPSVIYPVGDPLFIHMYMDDTGARAVYHAIEPVIPMKSSALLRSAEEGLAFRITEDFEFKDTAEQTAKLKELLAKVVQITDKKPELGTYDYDAKRRIIFTNDETYKALEYTLIKDKVGLGLIEPLIRDPYLEDISCDGIGPIFIEHKIFQSCRTTLAFETNGQLNEYAMRLSERVGRPATFRRPIVDATLPDGSRINIVFGEDLSMRGSNFTIRKFTSLPISITQLCSYNTMDCREAAYLWMLLEHNLNVWVCGETASGKTTNVKAILGFVKPTAKILTIEDTPEVTVPHDNWIREVTRQGEDEASSIGIFDLLKAALRQRPDYIIVGEVRGKEGLTAFQAMQTGHGVMATFHASSVTKLVQRLTGHPIEVPKTYIDVLNAVVIQTMVRVPTTGRVERRVVSISEIVGYDPVEQAFNFIELFAWDPQTDNHDFRGLGTSHVLEEKIAVMRGIPRKRVKDIYAELESRTEILSIMQKNQVFDYYDVWRYMQKIYGLGIEKSLALLKRGETL